MTDETGKIKVLKNKVEYIAKYRGKIKNVFFVEQARLCDGNVTDQAFDINAVND